MHFGLLLLLAVLMLSCTRRPVPLDEASNETVQLKVLQVFSAKDGKATLVHWKGQDVVAEDPLVETDYHVGDLITVLVVKMPFPDHKRPYDLIAFHVMKSRT